MQTPLQISMTMYTARLSCLSPHPIPTNIMSYASDSHSQAWYLVGSTLASKVSQPVHAVVCDDDRPSEVSWNAGALLWSADYFAPACYERVAYMPSSVHSEISPPTKYVGLIAGFKT